jgi:peptidoglycan/xylan/chitin deacetylase (PgdA/CDA1 family)
MKILSVFWHGIVRAPLSPDIDSNDVCASEFKAQVQLLLKSHTPISIREFLELSNGQRSLRSYTRPPVLLGFDDGLRSVIVNGLPILSTLGVPAVFFVIGELLRNPNFLPWFVEMKHIIRKTRQTRVLYRDAIVDVTSPAGRAEAYRLTRTALRASQSAVERDSVLTQLAETMSVRRPMADEVDEDLRFVTKDDLAQLGGSSVLTVASHAMTHRHLADLNAEEQRYELQQSDVVLREHSEAYCPVVAYPAGSFNSVTTAIARQIYQAGFAVFLNASYRDRYAYPRIGLGRTVGEAAHALSPVRRNLVLPLKRWLHIAHVRRVKD